MNTKKTTRVGLSMVLTVVALTASGANAALIDQGLTTLDTDTNLEWLDVTETTNLSYDEVSARLLDTGDSLFGYRYATTTEVGTFFTNGGMLNIVGNNFPFDFAAAQALVGLLGNTSTGSGTFSHGLADYVPGEFLFADPATQASLSQVSFNASFSTGFADASGSGRSLNTSDAETGSFLVREANISVSEPGAAALFGLGLLSFGLARRREVIS